MSKKSEQKEVRLASPMALRARMERWTPTIFILFGAAVMALFVWNFFLIEEKYNSPFDQIDAQTENRQGLLPVLELGESDYEHLIGGGSNAQTPNAEPEPDLAPALPVAAAPTLEAFPLPEGAEFPDLAEDPGMRPENLIIPAIDLYVPIISADYRIINYEGKTYKQWEAPWEYRAGWQTDSAGLGVAGNTVLYGHHNVAGKVFANVHKLEPGQVIQMKSGDLLFSYRVVLSMILEERGQPVEVRLDNARWILPSYDERVTLITCWPETGNTHRVVVVAVRDETGQPEGQSGMIPVTGDQAQAAPSSNVLEEAEVSNEPAIDALLWAPPVEGSPFEPDAQIDLEGNPGLEPTGIRIPIIGLGYPVSPIQKKEFTADEDSYAHWEAPHILAAGWETSSAGLGVPGNTVIFGWQDIYGAPFADLHKVLVGQVVQLISGQEVFNYRVAYTAILEEKCQDMLIGSENARWVLPSTDERVTLFTCYPQTGYSHRLVVVALREEQ